MVIAARLGLDDGVAIRQTKGCKLQWPEWQIQQFVAHPSICTLFETGYRCDATGFTVGRIS